MENKFFFKKVFRIANIEFLKWLVNPRMIITVCMVVFIWNFSLLPLIKLSNEMNSPLNTLEPFIAVTCSRVLNIVIPAVYLFLISDYPRIDKNSIYFLHRTGRKEWLCGQILFLSMSSFYYMLIIFLCSILPNVANSFFINGWSVAITRYKIYFPEKASSFAATLITKELYNQITPFGASIYSFFIYFLYLILIAFILLCFFVINRKKIGIVTVIGIIAVGSSLGIVHAKEMWLFPTAHAIINLHFTEHFKEPIMKLHNSFFYFIIFITLAVMFCLFGIAQTDFLNIDEND